MCILTSKGAHLHAIFVRRIEFNQRFIRGPTLPAHFSMTKSSWRIATNRRDSPRIAANRNELPPNWRRFCGDSAANRHRIATESPPNRRRIAAGVAVIFIHREDFSTCCYVCMYNLYFRHRNTEQHSHTVLGSIDNL